MIPQDHLDREAALRTGPSALAADQPCSAVDQAEDSTSRCRTGGAYVAEVCNVLADTIGGRHAVP